MTYKPDTNYSKLGSDKYQLLNNQNFAEKTQLTSPQ